MYHTHTHSRFQCLTSYSVHTSIDMSQAENFRSSVFSSRVSTGVIFDYVIYCYTNDIHYNYLGLYRKSITAPTKIYISSPHMFQQALIKPRDNLSYWYKRRVLSCVQLDGRTPASDRCIHRNGHHYLQLITHNLFVYESSTTLGRSQPHLIAFTSLLKIP